MRLITVKAEIEVPRVPNFLLYPGGKLSIADVVDVDLERIGEEWKRDLLHRAAVIRASRVGTVLPPVPWSEIES